MTREQIKQEAENRVCDYIEPLYTIEKQMFVLGAEWRINSVWHNSDEEPEERKEILVEYRFMTSDGEIEVRREVVESLDDLSDIYCDVLNWAYLDDLLKEEIKPTLKEFDLEAAKSGKPVCTRDGRKARIICFDRKANTPIVALIECDNRGEILQCVHNDGRCVQFDTSDNDLMMLPEKKEGWVNVYNRKNEHICENECSVSTGISVYKSKGEAKRNIDENRIYVNTIKITWEE